MNFVRTLTGISSDRIAKLEKLDHGQRLDLILASYGGIQFRLNTILDFLQSAPDSPNFGLYAQLSLQQNLPTTDIAKLRSIVTRICATTPSYRFQGRMVRCIPVYNKRVRDMYPRQADALVLAEK